MNARDLTPADEQAALQDEMEATRISFERWRQIHRRPTPMLIDQYPDKYEQLRRDEIRRQYEEE